MIYEFLGVFSAVLFLVGDFPYLVDTIKGVTQPQRVTWGVVFLLNLIGFANQHASGADNSLWLFGAATFATGAIFIASLKNGVGGHSRMDVFAIIASLLGIVLWVVFDDPLLSILANLLVAVVSLTPSYIKARKDPDSETKIAWLFGSISAALASISVGEVNSELLILPVSSTFLQLYMVYLLYVLPNKRNS